MNYIELTKKDLNQEIIDVYQDTFNQAPWFDQWDETTTTKRLTQLFGIDDFYGIALYDKELIGFILGYYEAYYDKTLFVIKEFCISPNVQRGGYGKKILKKLESVLQSKGCQSITLMTLNAPQTLNFYLKNDYQIEESLLMMSKQL